MDMKDRSPVTVYLIRHGEVDVRAGVLYGQMDVPLSERGREQSIRAARKVLELGVDGVVSSDLSRAGHMARQIERLGGPRPVFTERLREVDFGRWTGLSREQIEASWPGAMEARYADLVHYRPPGGENLMDMLERGWQVMEEIRSGLYGRRVAVTAHGGIIRVLTCRAIGLGLDKLFNIELDYACMNRLDIWEDGIFVLKFANLAPWSPDGWA